MSHCTALLKNYWLGPFKDEKEMKFVQNSCAKVFFHPKNVYDNPKISWRNYVTLYNTGPLSHCTAISDLFLIFCTMQIQLESLVYVRFSKSKMFDKKMSEKERVAKYREENKRATELATRKSNFKRTQLLSSGTPEAAKLREKAAARKRLQREREKQKMREKEEEEVRENVVGRRNVQGAVTPGN